MHVVRLKISGFRGIRSADITLGRHAVLVGPNNSGKTTVIEALALLFGRDRLVRRLTEHDFHGSAPVEATRIVCIATISGFPNNDPHRFPSWFSVDRGVEKWRDPRANTLRAVPDAQHTDLAVQIGFAARFDLDDLEAETIRFFVDDEATLGDPFAADARLHAIQNKLLQELGFFMVPASRTWDRWISFSSELFRRVVATRGGMPARAIRNERQRLWTPEEGNRLEEQPGLSDIVRLANIELRALMASSPELKLRLTATDSDAVLNSVVPHFQQDTGPTLPSARQGTGLVSLQSLLLLMQFGRARSDAGQSFVLAVEEPELHIQPSQQRRLVNRLNALCDQTIVTTHSPIVASMFPAPATLFVQTRDGTLNAKPLMATVPAQPSNHQQHLLYAWRQKLVAALMHECVLIPEGVSDVAWLEALQTALEQHQGWDAVVDEAPVLSTFVGIVPTIDAKITETFAMVSAVHGRPCILVDGDNDGRGYFETASRGNPQPSCAVLWAEGWAMEHVVSWIAAADEETMLSALSAATETRFADRAALTAYLLDRKSYAPTHENVAVTLMESPRCRRRASQLLAALCGILRDPINANQQLFEHLEADSTPAMQVFRFSPR